MHNRLRVCSTHFINNSYIFATFRTFSSHWPLWLVALILTNVLVFSRCLLTWNSPVGNQLTVRKSSKIHRIIYSTDGVGLLCTAASSTVIWPSSLPSTLGVSFLPSHFSEQHSLNLNIFEKYNDVSY